MPLGHECRILVNGIAQYKIQERLLLSLLQMHLDGAI